MAVGKLGSLVTTNPKPVGIFTSTNFKNVSVYVNNQTNETVRYSVGVSTDASTIQDQEYIHKLSPIGPLSVIELTDLYIDSGQTLVVQSSVAGVSFVALAADSTATTGYGKSDSVLITSSTKGINQTLSTPTRDIQYTLAVGNQSYDDAKVYVGVADSAGNLDNGWVIFAQTLAPGANFTINDLYVGDSQSIVVKSDIADVSFASLAKIPSGTGAFETLTVAGASNFQGRIVGAATSNIIPFLYDNYSDLPSASNYHGAFAHVHARNKAYFAHSANWWEIVNKEQDGTIGLGTEQVNVGVLTATSINGNLFGNVTGDVTGNVTGTSGGLTGTPDINVNNINSVDINASDLNVLGITTSGNFVGVGTRLSGLSSVTPGQYGNATAVAQITIDNSGRVSELTNVLISGGGGGGTEVIIFNDGSLVGTAGTINFGTGLNVTNVSSGLVTVTSTGAGSTAELRANTLVVSGVSTFSGITNVTGETLAVTQINASGVVTATTLSGSFDASQLTGTVDDARLSTVSSSKLSGALPAISGASLTDLTGASAATYGSANVTPVLTVDSNGRITGITTAATVGGGGLSAVVDDTSPQLGGDLDLNSSDITGTGQVNITGVCTATGYRTNSTTGDGGDVGFALKYYITANGTSAYRFAGPGVLNTTDDPTLYLHRGFTYIFENSTGGSHPFELRVSSGGAAYAPGGNFLTGSTTGTQVLTVPFDAPSSIVYQCTIHAAMLGTINIVT